jgi:hypothetical protein
MLYKSPLPHIKMALSTFLKLVVISKHSIAQHSYILKAKSAKIASNNTSSQPKLSAELRSKGNLQGILLIKITIITANDRLRPVTK